MQAVVNGMQQRRQRAQGAADAEGQGDKPHIFHAGVGQKPLDVALNDNKQRGDGYRQQAKNQHQHLREFGADGFVDDDVVTNNH